MENTNSTPGEAATSKLAEDLRRVVQDTEELLRESASGVTEKGREAQARLNAALESAKAACRDLEDKALAHAKSADQLIREHPYESIGIAFGIGLLIGVLLARK